MSAIQKRSVNIKGKNTSISLEDEFWTGLKEVAGTAGASLGDTIAAIHARAAGARNLSSLVRLAVLAHYQGAR